LSRSLGETVPKSELESETGVHPKPGSEPDSQASA
jgi:hypothetical protein